MKRVAVVGNSGAGKSTLAATLSVKIGLPLIATDTFYWAEGWQPVPPQIVRQRVTDAAAGETWILDGNFVSERDIVWASADTIVWLDYPLLLVSWRVVRRNLGWLFTRQLIWSGNQMSWRRAWSGVRHAQRSFAQKRATYPAFLAEFPHLHILHFHSPGQTKRWLQGLKETEEAVP